MATNNKNNNHKEKQPPILFNKTQAIIKQVNKLLGGTLVTYFNNPRGSVCHDDVLALFELLEKIGHQEKIYLFIKSSGGNGQASLAHSQFIETIL
jgi:ATP-dependent protease ClpP protease subunit